MNAYLFLAAIFVLGFAGAVLAVVKYRRDRARRLSPQPLPWEARSVSARLRKWGAGR